MKRLLFIIAGIGIILNSCESPKKELAASPKKTYNICGAKSSDIDWFKTESKAPLLDGLDVLNFPISTKNELVQKYFNQGLTLAYGFNHGEAARSFYYATQLDPECAMAYWGFSYVLGPNYNAGMESDNYERAYAAIQKAIELAPNTSPKEQALIQAMGNRYTPEPPEDRSSLDIAYSEAMKSVFDQYPDDADIAAMYAESVMDLHPWDLWDKEGNPKSWTPDILAAIEQVFDINPKHPGAHHFYIHAVEASNNPDLGNESAEMFDKGLVPGAGHLVHMPSHIHIRTGEYHKGTLSNIAAVDVDSIYLSNCHAQGAYPLGLYPHNYHFLAATATLEGNSKWALEGAIKTATYTHKQLMKEPGWGTLQHYYTIPYFIYVKFGMWDEILERIKHDPSLKYPNAIRAYSRGMAFLGKKEMDKAKSELQKLEDFAADKSFEEMTIWDINSVANLLQIGKRVLKAEILASEGEFEESMSLLSEAIEIEDALNYNEPPDWFFSVRHHLGAVQIEAGDYEAALQTYEEDLKRLPKNGWAYHGMKLAYEKLNENAKAKEMEVLLAVAWSGADIELSSSRIK
ncbi:MAG: hypothetical protein R8P61_15680 [Bacteroidia bacterium]|nr:hypothetical protein [Bacteroidia bacterium]